MTDEDRLLEIATRLMAGILGNQTLKITSKREGASDIETIASCSFAAADALMKEWRERTGAQGREQDVSNRLLADLRRAVHFAVSASDETGKLVWGPVLDRVSRVQRARAAGKGE